MAKGKIKAVLFIIVFLLAAAIVVNAMMDLAESKKPETTVDPFLVSSPSPDVTLAPSAPSATPVPTPVSTPVPTLVPTPTPAPTPTPTPIPGFIITPEESLIPAGQSIGSGTFVSDTGVPLNIRANWNAIVLDDQTIEVKVQVLLDSYALFIEESAWAVNVSVGEDYVTTGAPKVEYDGNEALTTELGSTVHRLAIPQGSNVRIPVAVEYHFGGTYSGEDLPVIKCGGYMELSR